jgi:thymidylate synthase ThyX
MIKAEIIADSIDRKGKRITSFVVTMPRIVLAELNTHRTLSRNSASSRAIPFIKMLEMVKKAPFMPIQLMKDHSGMQGSEFFTEESEIEAVKVAWLEARDAAVAGAEKLSALGLSKQFVNRGLEAYMWHTVIITATEFENFFALRAHEAAEIHIQKLAFLMLEEMNNSTPKLLQVGEWHIPFGDNMDIEKINNLIELESGENPNNLFNFNKFQNEYRIKIATARCARVSYTVVGEEGKVDNYANDVKLHDRLLNMGHLSPFEHCAQATDNEGWSGNFLGWTQYRKMLPNENRADSRLLTK